MNNKIGVIVNEKKYLERLQLMWKKYYASEFDLYGAVSKEKLKEIINIENLELILVEEENKDMFYDEKVPIVFLTRMSVGESEDGIKRIYKFQPISQIYHQIKKWMEENTIEHITQKKEEILNYKYKDRSLLNETDLGIIKNITVDLVPIYDLENETLRYDLRGLENLEGICTEKMTARDAYDMIGQICSLLMLLEDYLLEPSHVSLQIKHVFYHRESKKIKLMYIPIIQETDRKEMNSDLEKLIQTILHGIGDSSKIQNSMQETQYAQTAVFSNLQLAAKMSGNRVEKNSANETTLLIEREVYPFLLRKNTGEKIWINKKQFKIGKDKKMVDYCISDNPAISKNHADIKMQNGIYYIVDHHSLNATMLNGKIVPPEEWVQIKDEDCLIFANEKFNFYRNGY